MNIDKLKFYLGLMLINRGRVKAILNMNRSNNYDKMERLKYQNEKIKSMIKYSVNTIPYYTKLFNKLNLKAEDIETIDDLWKLPILTKSDIIHNKEDFYPLTNSVPYVNMSTGGSTGESLKYRVSRDSSHTSFALLIRGWTLGGYNTGDKVAILAGGSLIGKKTRIKDKIVDYFLNFKRLINIDSYVWDFAILLLGLVVYSVLVFLMKIVRVSDITSFIKK